MLEALPEGRWLGMNSAFKYWREIKKYPKFYACLDPVVVQSQAAGIRELLVSSSVEKYFLHDAILEIAPEVGKDSRVILHSAFLARTDLAVPMSPASRYKQTTGSMAARFAIEEGETNLLLIGIDCNYVEMIEEAKQGDGNELLVDRPVRRNPNYFFDGYQSEGDRYQFPNPPVHGGNLHLQSFVCLQNDLAASGKPVSVRVGSVKSLLHKYGVFHFNGIWKSLGRRRLQCVAVPMTRGELDTFLDNVELWIDTRLRPSLSARERGTSLHLFFDFAKDAEVVARVNAFLARYPEIYSYFDDVRLTFFDFPPEVNYYVRFGSSERRFCTKSGPNLFFLSVMEQCRGYEFTLQIEVDCLPLRAGWLDAADAELHDGAEEAWIVGPGYLGPSPMITTFRLQINGNAIYQTGSREFQDFLAREFTTLLKDLVLVGMNDMAYDTALSFAYANLAMASAPCREALFNALPRLRHSSLIVNASGEVENAAGAVDARALLRDNPGAFLVHGKFVAQAVRCGLSALGRYFEAAPVSRELPLTRAQVVDGGLDVQRNQGFVEALVSGGAGAGKHGIVAFHFARIDDSSPEGRRISFSASARGDIQRIGGVEVLLYGDGHACEVESEIVQDGAVAKVEGTTVALRNAGPVAVVMVRLVTRPGDAPLNLELSGITCRELLPAEGEGRSAKVVPPAAAIRPIVDSWREFLELGESGSSLSSQSLDLGMALENFQSSEFVLDHVGAVGTAVEIRLRKVVAQDVRSPLAQVAFRGFPWHGAGGIRMSIKGVGAGQSLLVRICRHSETPWEYHDVTVVDDQPRIVRNFFKALHSGFCFEIHKSHGLRPGQELVVRLERVARSSMSPNRVPMSLSERIMVPMETSALEEGWYPLETFDDGTYRWTGPDKRAALNLPIKRVREMLGVVAYYMAVTKQQLRRLRVEIDGETVPHVVRPDLRPRCIVFRISPRRSNLEADTELALVVPTVSPSSRSSKSTDDRPLGIAVISVAAIPAEPALNFAVSRSRVQSLRRRVIGPSKRERIADAFPYSHFDGLAYLEANPDAAEAVVEGAVASALEHYRKRGSKDGSRFALAVSRAPNEGRVPDPG
jgi:hypothetical protein